MGTTYTMHQLFLMFLTYEKTHDFFSRFGLNVQPVKPLVTASNRQAYYLRALDEFAFGNFSEG